jgi:RNA polymerase sigma-70 factor (ECF subfamily)
MQVNEQQYKNFLVMVREHERLIFKICNLYSKDQEGSKDLFQEIVLQAWTAFPRFNNGSKVSTWLYRVALNTAINHKRKADKHIYVDDTFSIPELADAADPGTDEYKLLYEMINDLPALEKALILLYLEDRSYQEISEIMGMSVTNVGTKLGRIKLRLKGKAKTLIN